MSDSDIQYLKEKSREIVKYSFNLTNIRFNSLEEGSGRGQAPTIRQHAVLGLFSHKTSLLLAFLSPCRRNTKKLYKRFHRGIVSEGIHIAATTSKISCYRGAPFYSCDGPCKFSCFRFQNHCFIRSRIFFD